MISTKESEPYPEIIGLHNDDETWCCKKKKCVFVHKYKSKFCRKIVNAKTKVKGILKNKRQKKPTAHKVSFIENDKAVGSSFMFGSKYENSYLGTSNDVKLQKNGHSSKFSLDWTKTLEHETSTARTTYACFKRDQIMDSSDPNISFLEYDSFDQPTISLSFRKEPETSEMSQFANLIDENDVTKPVLLHASKSVQSCSDVPLAGTGNVPTSPDGMKLMRRIRKRKTYGTFSQNTPTKFNCLNSRTSELNNLIFETETMRNSSCNPPFCGTHCNIYKKKIDTSSNDFSTTITENSAISTLPFAVSTSQKTMEDIMNISFNIPDEEKSLQNGQNSGDPGFLCDFFDLF